MYSAVKVKKSVNGTIKSINPHSVRHSPHRRPRDSPNAHLGLFVVLNYVVCTVGIYASFLGWSLLHERILTTGYMINGEVRHFRSPFITSIFGTLCPAILGLIAFSFQRRSHITHWVNHSKPLFLLMTLTHTISSPIAHYAITRISFPVLLTVKMSKMVPIMLFSTLWYRKSFNTFKYVSVALITSGVLGFSLLANKKQGNDSSYIGLILCFISLILDGFTNSTQDVIMQKTHGALSAFQLMFETNLYGCFWGIIYVVAVEFTPTCLGLIPEFSTFLDMFLGSWEVRRDLVLFGFIGGFGQLFIFRALNTVGSLTLAGINVSRKVGSLVLSIFIHNHNLAGLQWVSLAGIIAGVILDIVANVRDSRSAAKLKKIQ